MGYLKLKPVDIMSFKVCIIGRNIDYQKYFNLINNEVEKNNLTIVGAKLSNARFKYINNVPVIDDIKDLKKMDFDYFILVSEDKEIYQNLHSKYKFKQKIIPARVFEVPYFNFKKYVKLLENPPSIISRHCWGGLLFHKLGLKFTSPFVNLFLNEKDFNKLTKNFSYYMKQELIYFKDGYEPNLDSKYPIVKLDDITLHFNHYSSFDEAKLKWNQRKKRLNFNNLFFETTIEDNDLASEFNSINVKHKLCFCLNDFDNKNMINFSDFLYSNEKGKLGMIVNATATGIIPYFDLIDLLLNDNFECKLIKKESSDSKYFNSFKIWKK